MPVAAPVAKPRANGAPANNGPSAAIPFTRAAREKSALVFDTGAVQLGAAVVTPGPIQLPAAGFLKYVQIEVIGTTAGNAATVTFAADGPWNAISQVSLTNSAGDSILVSFTGYQLFLINKYGLLGVDAPYCDPRNDGQYTATAGSGATGGSFHYMLRVPLEQDPRDAFTAVPNEAANKAYNLQFQYAASATIYGTAPTSAPTLEIIGVHHFWSAPNNTTNAAGTPQQTAPIGNGSVSMWRLQTAPLTAGDKLIQLTNVGNVIKLYIYVLRNAAGARIGANTDWPAISQFIVNNDTWFYKTYSQWQQNMAQDYGYNGAVATKDVAAGLDTGVFVLSDFINQRGRALVDGPRDQWLPTLDSTLVQLRGTSFGANAATLEIISNEIKPVSPAALYSLNVS